MVNSNTSDTIAKINKPVSNINLEYLTNLMSGDENNENNDNNNNNKKDISNKHKKKEISDSTKEISESDKEISLLEFSRLYKIGQIPIMDFIAIYIILYLFNSICLHYNYKLILVSTIPITILFDILTNNNLKISGIMIFVLIISILYLIISVKNQS